MYLKIHNHFHRIRNNNYIQMRILQSTRTCPICGTELRESNVVLHARRCTKLRTMGKLDGSWECTYSDTDSCINNMDGVISATSCEALEYLK